MKTILKIIIATLVFLNSILLFGTIQTSEKLIIGIDTFKIDQFPFEPFLERDRTILPSLEKKNEDGTSEICISSGCWRGYIGTWTIINDSLFLKSLEPSCGLEKYEGNPYALEKIFNDKVTPNGIFAYWVNDTFDTRCYRSPCDEPWESIDISNGEINKISASEFIKKIDSLGFFKYTDDEEIEALKKSHLVSFNRAGSWGTIWDDDTNLSLDFRYYFCDGEYVFEIGGFVGMLEELKPTFEKIGFKFTIDNHFEEYNLETNSINHNITINGTDYIIFKNYKGYGWGEAVQRFAEIVNTELDKQGIKENIYLINGGNDGALIFLDDELYNYFYEVFTDPYWKPLEVSEWVKVMELEQMDLD